MRPGVDLSIVVPAFNEAERLPRTLSALAQHLRGSEAEVIVVDDGSEDNTADVARDALADVPRNQVVRLPMNAGKGAAVRIGVSRARGRRVAFMDADLATDLGALPALLERLGRADVAVGSRAVAGSVVTGATATRTLLGRGFNRFVRHVGGLDIRDTQCGFKAFRGPVAKLLFHLSRVNGFAFDVEVLMLATRLGLRVAEVPVRWEAVPGSHVRPLRDPLPMALDVARAHLRWRRLPPVTAVTALCPAPDERREVAGEMRTCLRASDPIIPWRQGATALLPCTEHSAARRVANRLRRRLPSWPLTVSRLPGTRFVPASAGLLTALRA